MRCPLWLSDSPVGGGLSSIYSWDAVVCISLLGSNGSPAAATQVARDRNESILHFASDWVLRRQRQKPAALETASTNCLLDFTQRARVTDHGLRALSASVAQMEYEQVVIRKVNWALPRRAQ